MATIDHVAAPTAGRRWAVLGVGVLAAVGLAFVLLGLRRPPQMGPDDRVFHTVDALYTAVRSRNVARLDDCDRRLRDYRDAGSLPAPAAKYLDDVIRTARSGQWQPAAEALYHFMRTRRRDGAAEPPPKPKGRSTASRSR